MVKCECCGEIDARAAILSWSDDPQYGVPDLRGAPYAYKCLDNPITPVAVRAMGERIRARRVPRILPETLPAGTKAFFSNEVFVTITKVVRRGACNAYDGEWQPSSGKAMSHPPMYMWAEQILWNEVAKAVEPEPKAPEKPVEPASLYNGSNLELDSEIAMKMSAHPNHRKPYFRPEPKAKPDVVHVWPEHWSTPTWES
jgi:hypothetical protein